MRVKYLTGEDILVIHARILDRTGGAHGVRDVGLLASFIERPKAAFGGTELYAGIFTKAAAYLESIACYHAFIDGNKRTAIAVAARFLYMNGHELIATNEAGEVFMLKVATKSVGLASVAAWLKENSRKFSNP